MKKILIILAFGLFSSQLWAQFSQEDSCYIKLQTYNDQTNILSRFLTKTDTLKAFRHRLIKSIAGSGIDSTKYRPINTSLTKTLETLETIYTVDSLLGIALPADTMMINVYLKVTADLKLNRCASYWEADVAQAIAGTRQFYINAKNIYRKFLQIIIGERDNFEKQLKNHQ